MTTTALPTTGSRPPISVATRLLYGLGAAANGVKSNGFNYLLLFYYSQVLGLPAQLVSYGIFIALMFDAISDPLIGYISDNVKTRWGRRHPFMYISGVPVAAAYMFLWAPPEGLDQTSLFIYFVVISITVRTLITFYEVPANALVPEMTDDYDERTSLMSYRYFFAWWGGLSIAVMAYLVFLPESKGGMEYAQGFVHYGMAASVIILISIYASTIGTHKYIPYLKQPTDQGPRTLRDAIIEPFETLTNRSFLALFVAALFTAAASGLSASMSIYFSRHFWELTTSQIGYMNLPYFGSALAALYIAPYISRWLGKKRGALTILAAYLTFLPLPYLLRVIGWFPENGTESLFWTLVTVNTLEVMLHVIWSILVAAMIADVVEDSEVKTGRRNEGLFFAANTFAQKAVNGIGVIIAGQVLAAAQFPEGAKPGEVAADTLINLALTYVPILLGLYLIAVGVLTAYRISREKHTENLQRLAELAEEANLRTAD